MREIIEDAIEFAYEHSATIYLVLTIVLMLYGLAIQIWLIVCVCLATTFFAVTTFIRYQLIIKRQDAISKKLEFYTLEQKKEIVDKALPSIQKE